MTFLWILLSVALSVSLGLFMAIPFFERSSVFESSSAALPVHPSGDPGSESTDVHARLVDKKERALRSYRDLELDYSMGKITQDDFVRAQSEATREIALILKELGEV